MKKKQTMFKTPILLIVFNRPETTRKVFESIKKMKPSTLYVVADGPRLNKSGEEEMCKKVRRITEDVNWKCKVHRLYRKSNLGCGKSVSGAIDWFFKNVDSGIILEDDCLPNNDFYYFMTEMLSKYKSDKKVMHISGDNFMSTRKQNGNFYYMSKYAHVWGWGTWKHAWNNYDYNMNSWKSKNLFEKLKSVNGNIWERLYWTSKFDSVLYKVTDTWDYQWLYTVMKNNSYSVVPGRNLVSNIGFGLNSTHTSDDKFNQSELKVGKLSKRLVLNNNGANFDEYERNNHFHITPLTSIVHFAYFSIVCMLYNMVK